MKEKLLQFFTGKMGKSVYISTVAAVVCGAVVITSTVIVHNNNQKIDAVLESLSASESITESDTESTTETVSAIQTNADVSNNEPSGDKALQYIAEYDRLTKEYEAKRAELKNQTVITAIANTEKHFSTPEPQSRPRARGGAGNYLETEEEYNSYLAEFQKQHDQWEQERQRAEAENMEAQLEAQRKSEEEKARIAEVQNQINALDAHYEKDVADLKARYGIS